MQHPFDGIAKAATGDSVPVSTTNHVTRRSLLGWLLAGLGAVVGTCLAKSAGASELIPGGVTSQALGEGGGIPVPPPPTQATTLVLGEEGGFPRPVTTQAMGEEGGATTLMLGEEGGLPRPITTEALGEEGGLPQPTTFMVGEEGGLPPTPTTTTAIGEEGGRTTPPKVVTPPVPPTSDQVINGLWSGFLSAVRRLCSRY